ncbi:hypothetical protein BDR26DRAFT_1006569, partial [Obelidium mucronatum]
MSTSDGLHTRKSTAIDAMLGGAVAYLESCPGVCRVQIGTTRTPVPSHAVARWEAAASKAFLLATGALGAVALPDDLKTLYDISDGFSLQWSARFGPATQSGDVSADAAMDSTVLGSLHINGIDSLVSIANSGSLRNDSQPNNHQSHDEIVHLKGLNHPPGLPFLLQDSCEYGKICLVYGYTASKSPKLEVSIQPPQIWFQSAQTKHWHYITHSLNAFFRLAVLHLGIRGWPILYTDEGVPQEVLDWLAFYSPGHTKLMRSIRAVRLKSQNSLNTENGKGTGNNTDDKEHVDFLWFHNMKVNDTVGDSEFDLDKVQALIKLRKDKEAASAKQMEQQQLTPAIIAGGGGSGTGVSQSPDRAMSASTVGSMTQAVSIGGVPMVAGSNRDRKRTVISAAFR